MKHRWSWWLVRAALGALAVVLAMNGWMAYSRYTAEAARAAAEARQAAQEARGEYFRLTARYVYKGVPMTLDYGINCGPTLTIRKADGGARFHYGGPNLYGAVTHDNKALVVSTTSFCGSTWQFRRVRNYFPAVVIYDDPNTLAHGFAYVSEDAFDRPESPLKFLGADIKEFSSVADFKAFASTEAPNAVSMFNSAGQIMGANSLPPPQSKLPIATDCRGWWRLPIPEQVRAQFRAAWPPERPRYWRPQDTEFMWQLIRAFQEIDRHWGGHGGATNGRLGVGPGHEGIVRRDGTGNSWNEYQGRSHAGHRHADRYPTINRLKDGEPFEEALDIAARPDHLGLYYCGHWAATYEQWQVNKNRRNRTNTILPEGVFTINGMPIDGLPPYPIGQEFFEADTHIWGSDMLTLSARGEQGSGR